MVENALVRLGKFRLPGKKVYQSSDTLIEVVLVDVREQDRTPEKKQKLYYSGKKKRHTQKAQVIIHQQSMQIICSKKARPPWHVKYFVWQMRIPGFDWIARQQQNTKEEIEASSVVG